MTSITAPQLSCVDGVFVVEPGPDYSQLYEPMLEYLGILEQLAESADSARVVLDMNNVDLLGSAMIGYLVSTARTLSKRGGRFALANANKFCQTAINLTQLSSVLPNYEGIHAAINAVKS